MNNDKTGEVAGLPVAGYKPTQSLDAIAAVDVFKELEERVLRHIEALEVKRDPKFPENGKSLYDNRMLAVGRTQLQIAFMALNRAIFQPQRVALPED